MSPSTSCEARPGFDFGESPLAGIGNRSAGDPIPTQPGRFRWRKPSRSEPWCSPRTPASCGHPRSCTRSGSDPSRELHCHIKPAPLFHKLLDPDLPFTPGRIERRQRHLQGPVLAQRTVVDIHLDLSPGKGERTRAPPGLIRSETRAPAGRESQHEGLWCLLQT